VRLHRKHISAVEQGFIRIGVIGKDPVDQFILSQHTPMMGVAGAFAQQAKRGICG
jgi:hypothetical protein